MLYAIVWLFLHCFVYFFYKYCLDSLSFPNSKAELHSPSVYDLGNDADHTTIERYTSKVIVPLADYENYNNLCTSKYAQQDSEWTFFFFELVALALSVKSLAAWLANNYFSDSSFYSFSIAILAVLSSCLLLQAAIRFVYKRTLAIKPFSQSPDELVSSLKSTTPDFPISYSRHCSNYIMRHYLDYYYTYASSLQRRRSLITIIEIIAAIIYVLFFFVAP